MYNKRILLCLLCTLRLLRAAQDPTVSNAIQADDSWQVITNEELVLKLYRSLGPDMPSAKEVPLLYMPIYLGDPSYYDTTEWKGKLPFKSISLVIEGRTVDSPSYSFILYIDGSARLEVRRGLPKLGKFKSEPGVLLYARICHALELLRFKELRSYYKADTTSHPAIFVQVVMATGSKLVSDCGRSAPIELWIIQVLLKSIQDRLPWQEEGQNQCQDKPRHLEPSRMEPSR